MYGLSATEDLSFLVHVELIQVCIGANEAILNFDKGVSITIMSDFSVTLAHETVRYDNAVRGAEGLLALLNSSIVMAEAARDGSLRVTFNSGAELVVFDTSDSYESFWLKGPNREIIV